MSPGQTGHITGQTGRVPGTDGTHTLCMIMSPYVMQVMMDRAALMRERENSSLNRRDLAILSAGSDCELWDDIQWKAWMHMNHVFQYG